MKRRILIYDTTLRDGVQGEGMTFTLEDKVRIARRLDDLGVDYIEGGNPFSNPKDAAFFQRMRKEALAHARLAAFGATCRPETRASCDAALRALAEAGTDAVAVFGKCSRLHAQQVLRTTCEENLRMIGDSVRFLKDCGKEVIFDAEHFFDGYLEDAAYAMACIACAIASGADVVTLCDTNGGTLTEDIARITAQVVRACGVPVAIHCHNDAGLAVAGSLAAVAQGASMVQGTINGYGERCGNANLCTVIPNLVLKMGMDALGEGALAQLTSISRFVAQQANLPLPGRAPYVGASAFAHKGGMHIDAIMKTPVSFEHVPPETVGNERRTLLSEVAGRSSLLPRISRIAPELSRDDPKLADILEAFKQLEMEGYQFEGAESSFELMVYKMLGKHKPLFDVVDFRVQCDQPWLEGESATAIVKVAVGGEQELTAGQGNGPVNALDTALRKALSVFFPQLAHMRLMDFRVRVIDTDTGTESRVRVHIESSDGQRTWRTMGVSPNIIEASFIALTDSIECMLLQL
nr:citramalate synthase [Maliibacterium massiliense]